MTGTAATAARKTASPQLIPSGTASPTPPVVTSPDAKCWALDEVAAFALVARRAEKLQVAGRVRTAH
jgi:hypothetical protein